MFLTFSEVVELTHKKRRPAQVRALRHMGIEHRIRPDGTVAVSRSHVENLLAGNTSSVVGNRKSEPNWNAVK